MNTDTSSSVRRAPVSLAVYSMWRRELTRFWRQKSRLIGAVATPLVFWLVLGAGFGRSFNPTGGASDASYLEYFFPGTVVLAVLFTAIYSTISIIEDRQEGFLQGVMVAPVSRGGIVAGKMLGATTLAVVQGVVMLMLAPLIGLPLSFASFCYAIAALFGVALGLSGLGLMIAWSMDSTAGFHAIMNLLLMPMWLLSGAVFPIADAHPILKAIMYANPLTYGVSGFRAGLYHNAAAVSDDGISIIVSLVVTVLFAMFMLFGSIRMANRPNRGGRS